MGERPCLSCGAPLDAGGVCRRPFCIYNTSDEQKEFESRATATTAGEGPQDSEQAAPAEGEDETSLLPEELPEDHEGHLPPDEPYTADDQQRDESELEKFDTANEEKGETPEQDEDEAYEDDDEGLPPRPSGCAGECKPGKPGEGVPCPHCTAKRYRDEMRGEERANEPDKEKYVAKELSRVQERRFDEIVRRLEPKTRGVFGKTMDDYHKGSKQPSQFPGEDISQTIQIESNGVTYFITVAAARVVR